MLRQGAGFDAAALIKLAKMRHCLLNDATSNPYATHQPP
jgi:hypothetical protein